jgi:exonuclease SbcC
MRPTRLELEGFISFRERTEIDFSSLDLFGITGPTGAGKTALIDSMIFALYGKTPRLGEKAVQELISQGSAQLKVLLEFECGGAEYRVLRIVKRKGAGRAQIERKRDGEWDPILGSTRELRDRVEEIIGLDFDGFTKTVVLPQGQFDRFLRGDGAARRKILSDLLGLDVYERMMRRANEIARDANRQCDVLTEMGAQHYGAATPERLAELDASIGDAARARQSAAAELSMLEKALPFVIQLRQTEADFARFQTERNRLRKSLEAAAAQVGEVRRRIEKMRSESAATGYDAERHLEVTSKLPVARRHAELLRAIAALEKRRQAESKSEEALSVEAESARVAWNASVARSVEAAEAADRAAAEWSAFRLKHGSADLLAEAARDAAGIEKTRAAIAAIEEQSAQDRKALAGVKKEAESLSKRDLALGERLTGARLDLERVRFLHAAAGVRRLLEEGKPCPVCLHPVEDLPEADQGHASLESAERELRAAETDRERVRSSVAANRLELETLPKRIEAAQERSAQLAQSLRAIETVVERLSGMTLERGHNPSEILNALATRAKSSEAEAIRSEKLRRMAVEGEASLLNALNDSETRLALVRQARQSTVRELDEKKLEMSNASSSTELEDLEAEARMLAKARELHERLAREQTEVERAGSKAEVDERSISERLALTSATLASLSERTNELRSQLEGLPLDEGIDARLVEARDRLQRIESALGSARLARKTFADQAREAEELARRVAILGKEGEVYSRLGSLLRTDQFTAWILKDAFARLAYEGSRQLETLSNGRYTFAAGGDDFAVCDRWNAGERRSVNTLSGGESFLASLALALALSRGLPEFAANRDSLHLDSLFLDEGFSTLDAETLDTVLGAVEMLQADCRLIGVISHAPELADRLPGRIEVVKGANGSRVIVR